MDERAVDAFIGALNAATAALIDTDPSARRRLAGLRGQSFCLEITVPRITLYLLPTARGVEFRREGPAAAVTLTGSALALAGMAVGRGGRRGVSVRGDAELGRELQKILAGLDLDWEELLARGVGDTPARKAGNVLRAAARWAGESGALTRENVGDYLTQEREWLVTAKAAERHAGEVDEVRAAVDRLAARVGRLQGVVGGG